MPDKRRRRVTLEDYEREFSEREARDQGQLKYIAIHIVLLFAQLITLAVLYRTRSPYTYPFLGITVTSWLIVVVILLLRSLRCPNCGRFFPKGELVEFDTIGGKGDIFYGGEWQYHDGNKRIYWTECRHCGHLLWIVKGG
ncbi:MAG: DUF2975 domain-containing protein [Spirochaetes bacterium]|nr:DUF2975 domain-containing protein [Spirochaetota bacterium]